MFKAQSSTKYKHILSGPYFNLISCLMHIYASQGFSKNTYFMGLTCFTIKCMVVVLSLKYYFGLPSYIDWAKNVCGCYVLKDGKKLIMNMCLMD